MTFREKLADWISGGKLTCETERADLCRDLLHIEQDLNTHYENALRHIMAQETTTANATVKRMAKIARDAVDD